MNQSQRKFRFIFRYVYGLLGMVSVAAIAVIVSFYIAQKVDREARDHVTFFHIESTVIADRLLRENQSLLRILGYEIPDIAELAPIGSENIQRGPDASGTLQMIATRIQELKSLDAQYGEEEFAATLERLDDRFETVRQSVQRGDLPAASRRAILSFDLTIRQLHRQHAISAENMYLATESFIARITPYMVIVAVILIAAGAVSWLTMRLLHQSIMREVKTEQALAESVERMHHLQKLESLGRLVGGVAHDFNNLLTAILGQTGLLLDRSTDERTRHGLNEIREAGQQAASLTRQLLNFSRPQAAEILVVDVNELVRSIEGILTRLIGEDVALSIGYGDEMEPVELDPRQLQQVIINLVVNARDAMPDGGQLSIATETITVGESGNGFADVPPGNYTRISVADSGIGMDRETLEHIFEPYFTTKAMGRGTGLGLSTVYGVVNAAGGHVNVTSEPGVGSRFEVLLPVSVRPVSDTAGDQVPAAALGGEETVLVVEDEDKIREFLKEGLESLGYRVLDAANATEGIEACAWSRGRVDVILSDVILPGKNGAEFIIEARKLQPEATSILMSGYTDDVLQRTGIDSSEVPLLYKPFEIADVAGLIREQRS